jgi:hypothetical protein
VDVLSRKIRFLSADLSQTGFQGPKMILHLLKFVADGISRVSVRVNLAPLLAAFTFGGRVQRPRLSLS